MLAFGAGALISAVSFDLAQNGARLGDPGVLALGLGLGATAYFALNRMLARPRRRGNEAAVDDDGGTELALGAFLDGVPEQLVLGIGVATGEGVSVSLLVAIFVQPPGGDRLVCRDARRGTRPAVIRRLWMFVALVWTACAAPDSPDTWW